MEKDQNKILDDNLKLFLDLSSNIQEREVQSYFRFKNIGLEYDKKLPIKPSLIPYYVKYILNDMDFGPFDRFIRRFRKGVVKRYIKKSGLKDYSILDAGCGRQAALGWDIREECKIYFGIDRDIPSVRISNLKLITGEVEKAMSTIKDNSLDYVVSLALIEHLEEPGMFLRDIHRVLKNDGHVLITTPPPISEPVLELLSFLKIINGDEIDEHKNYFTKKTLNELLSENGFEVLELKKFLLGFNLFAVGKK